MFASLAMVPLALAAMQISIPLGKPPRHIEQPRAPIATEGTKWTSACKQDDGWDTPAPPVRIHGNTYLVGTCGISAILITGSEGHVLIDGGTEAGAEIIAANIRGLGFGLRDIKLLLHSHEHFDHVGGIARLQQLTGATLVASAPAARVFATGAAGAGDPQAGMHKPFPAASVGRLIADGEELRLGDLMLTAMSTPGHTPGALSWRWESCDGGVCRTIVYADSLSPVSRDDYRFSDHPAYLAAFRASIAKVSASRCEILLTPHPSASAMPERIGRGETLLDEQGCRAYATALTSRLDERLAKEAAAK
jgi:metallo-beta-lactamase class B